LKNTITLFMSEVLYRTIRDGADPDGLFDWCERSILTLDALESDFSNYPIRFLLELAVTLGFQPTAEDMAPYAECHLSELRTFLQAPFGESMLLPLSGNARNEIAQSILRYLEHHTESAIQIRSLAVLRELFSETGKL
jgi:DNA repair protein RecO (recombination protein O)